MPGISTSAMTRSGGRARADVSACRAPGALATSCPAISSSEASASRFARLSSTTRMVAMVGRQSTRNASAAARANCEVFRRQISESTVVLWLQRVGGEVGVGVAAPPGDGRLDDARIGGLDEVVMEPGLGRARAVFLLTVAGERDEKRRTDGASLA